MTVARPAAPARPSPATSVTGLAIAWSVVLTALLLWPLAGPGDLMLRDMAVPAHPALTDAALGLGDAPARAVPQDALLALAGQFTNAARVASFLLFAAFIIGGTCAAELARRALSAGATGQIAAVTITLWNPFTVERLLQGQWSLVLAAVLLPAVAVASAIGATWWRATLQAAAGLTPTGALLALICAVIAARTWRDRAIAATTGVAACAPWLIATAAAGSTGLTSDPDGAAAFAARAENHVGTIGALAGLGGIWNGQVVPASREDGAAALAVILLLALFAVGLRRAWAPGAVHAGIGEAPVIGVRRHLILLAAAAVIIPALLATAPGIGVMEWLIAHVPGAGLFRDAQKWVALALPGYVILAAAGATALAARLPRRRHWLAAATAGLIIMVAVPEAPAAVAPLRPVASWPGWQPVAGLVAMTDQDIAVLPAGTYRTVMGRPVVDPATKILPGDVLSTGDLAVGGTLIRGEADRAAQVQQVLVDAPAGAIDQLRHLGVGWVLMENSPGEVGRAHEVLGMLDPVYSDAMLALFHVPGAVADQPGPDRAPAWLGLVVWAVLSASGPVAALVGGVSRARVR